MSSLIGHDRLGSWSRKLKISIIIVFLQCISGKIVTKDSKVPHYIPPALTNPPRRKYSKNLALNHV